MEKLETEKSAKKAGFQLSEKIHLEGHPGKYEIAFRRWVVREIQSGRMTVGEFAQQFELDKRKASELVRYWSKPYVSQIVHTLPIMDEKEKQKLAALEKQNKALLKQLEEAQMKNIILETLIDVAEEDLKIKIRRKPGSKL